MKLPELKLRGLPDIANLDQYCGPWSIEAQRCAQLIATVSAADFKVHVEQNAAEAAEAATNFGYEIQGRTAVIEIYGTMTKHGSSFARGGSTVRARRSLRNALNDPNVGSILLLIESPGGSVAGTKELADDVRAAAQQKPTWAYIEDIGASAAYWVASAAHKIFANDVAYVGSIGTYMVIDDWSKAYEEHGVKAHLVTTGEFKGAGVAGIEIQEKHLAHWQELINKTNDLFLAAVQKGRGFTKAQTKQLADGRVHMAADAKDLGLIDGVQSLDKTLAGLSKAKPAKGAAASVPEQLESDMTQQTENPPQPGADNKPQPATYQQIVSACEACDPAKNADDAQFVTSCLAKGMTAEQTTKEWMATLVARAESAREEAAESKKAAEEAGKTGGKGEGVDALEDGPDAGNSTADAGDPIAEFKGIVAEHEKAGLSKERAIRKAAIENPELHQSYLAAYGEQSRKGRRPGESR